MSSKHSGRAAGSLKAAKTASSHKGHNPHAGFLRRSCPSKAATMKVRILIACSLALLLAVASTGGVLAHASLSRANIKNGAVYHVKTAPKVLQAFFAENLDPKQSWINVFEDAGDHGLVNEKTKSVVNFRNPKEMTLKLPALRPNKYYFVWYTHSEDDGHFAAGIVYFSVVK